VVVTPLNIYMKEGNVVVFISIVNWMICCTVVRRSRKSLCLSGPCGQMTNELST
jgi:hypothetical protein